jgi:hypothetical protein
MLSCTGEDAGEDAGSDGVESPSAAIGETVLDCGEMHGGDEDDSPERYGLVAATDSAEEPEPANGTWVSPDADSWAVTCNPFLPPEPGKRTTQPVRCQGFSMTCQCAECRLERSVGEREGWLLPPHGREG